MITSLNLYRTYSYFAGQRNTVCIDKNLYNAPNTKFDNLLNYGLLIENLDGTTYKIFDEYIDVKAEILQANSNYLLATYARLEYDYEDGEMPFVKYYRINRIEDRPNIIRLYWELDTFMTYWQYAQSTFNENNSIIKIKRTNLYFEDRIYYGDLPLISTNESEFVDGALYHKSTGSEIKNNYDFVIVIGLKYAYESATSDREPNRLRCVGFPFKVNWKSEALSDIYRYVSDARTIYEYKTGKTFKKCQILNMYVVPANLINIELINTPGEPLAYRRDGTAHYIDASGEKTRDYYRLILNPDKNYIKFPDFTIKPNFSRMALHIGNTFIELPEIITPYKVKFNVGISDTNLYISLELPDANSIDITNHFAFPAIQNNTETTQEQQNRILEEALTGISIGVNLLAGAATGGVGLVAGTISAGTQIGNAVAQSNQNKINRQLSSGGQGNGQLGLITYQKLQPSTYDPEVIMPNSFIDILQYKISDDRRFYYEVNGGIIDIIEYRIKDLPNNYLFYDPETEEQPLAYIEFDTQLFGIPNDYINDIKDIINNGVYIKWL